MFRPWMGIPLVALPLLATPARANSITTYGVIITALGNDMQVQTVDKAEAAAMMSGGAPGTDASATDLAGKGDGVMITPNGSGGLVVTPWNNSAVSSPAPSGGGATSGGSLGGGVNDVSQVPVPSAGPIDVGSTASVPPIVAPQEPAGAAGSDPAGGDLGQPQDGTVTPVANTPEPASLTLLAIAGVGGWGFARRRRV